MRNASDTRRRRRRCRRATPTQNPHQLGRGLSARFRTSEARTGASAPLHSYQVWPPSGSNAGSSNLRYRQRPILIKNLRISLSRKHVVLYSDSIGSETGRSLQPRRPTLRIGRGAGSGSDDAQSVGRWQRSFEGGWLVYAAAKRRHRLAVSASDEQRRRRRAGVADVLATNNTHSRNRPALPLKPEYVTRMEWGWQTIKFTHPNLQHRVPRSGCEAMCNYSRRSETDRFQARSWISFQL